MTETPTEAGIRHPFDTAPAEGAAVEVAPGILWLRLPQGMDSSALLPQAIANGVAYVPGAAFYSSAPDVRTLRLSFVTSTAEQIDQGIAALAQTVRAAMVPPQAAPAAV